MFMLTRSRAPKPHAGPDTCNRTRNTVHATQRRGAPQAQPPATQHGVSDSVAST